MISPKSVPTARGPLVAWHRRAGGRMETVGGWEICVSHPAEDGPSADTGNLLLSAIAAADVTDADAFQKALAAADFDSVRGNFKFGPNQHPIQDFVIREVVDDNGVLTNKLVGTVMTDHADAYAAECKM